MNDTHYANYQVETGLGDVAKALWRRKWIIVLVTVLFAVGAHYYAQNLPKQWAAVAQLRLVERPDIGTIGDVQSGYHAPAPDSIATQIGMLQTAAMADRALRLLKDSESSETEGINIGTLQGSLSVSNPLDSQLINISVLGSSRDQALQFTNAIAESFVQWKQEDARRDVQATEVNLKKQTAAARRQMDAARVKQLAYQKGHEILDSGSQTRIGIERLQTRTDAVTSIKQDLDVQQVNVSNLAAQLKTANTNIQQSGGRDDAQTSSLSAQLNSLKLQRDDLARRVTPAYPGKLPLLDAQIADIQKKLKAAVAATQNAGDTTLQAQGALQQNYLAAAGQLKATQAKLTNAIALQNEAAANVAPLVDTGSTYDQIARQAQEATVHYTGLQEALNSAQLREIRSTATYRSRSRRSAAMPPLSPTSRSRR